MSDKGKKFFHQICCEELHAGGVDTGVAGKKLLIFYCLPINQKLNLMLCIIHQPQDADRTGSNIQEPLHILRPSKRQPGTADLLRQYRCAEFFLAGNQQQVKPGFLAVGKKEIFADGDSQKNVYIPAVADGLGGRVIHPLIGDAQLIEKIIGADLLFQTAGAGGSIRAAKCQGKGRIRGSLGHDIKSFLCQNFLFLCFESYFIAKIWKLQEKEVTGSIYT